MASEACSVFLFRFGQWYVWVGWRVVGGACTPFLRLESDEGWWVVGWFARGAVLDGFPEGLDGLPEGLGGSRVVSLDFSLGSKYSLVFI